MKAQVCAPAIGIAAAKTAQRVKERAASCFGKDVASAVKASQTT